MLSKMKKKCHQLSPPSTIYEFITNCENVVKENYDFLTTAFGTTVISTCLNSTNQYFHGENSIVSNKMQVH